MNANSPASLSYLRPLPNTRWPQALKQRILLHSNSFLPQHKHCCVSLHSPSWSPQHLTCSDRQTYSEEASGTFQLMLQLFHITQYSWRTSFSNTWFFFFLLKPSVIWVFENASYDEADIEGLVLCYFLYQYLPWAWALPLSQVALQMKHAKMAQVLFEKWERMKALWHRKPVSDNCWINPRQITLNNHFITGLK